MANNQVAALALAITPAIALADGDNGDGEHRNGDLLRSGLVGSTTPAAGGATIFGVVPGAAPWVVDEGMVRVRRDERLDLRVEGLVIPTPPQNGTNPVGTLTATLCCNDVAADATDPFPLSIPDGDARISAELTLPKTCVAPVVLLNPRGNAGTYIAATG